MLNYVIRQLNLLGISANASRCYSAINQSGSITISQIARQLKILPNAVYPIIRKLQKSNLIVPLDTYPIRFQSNPSAINTLIDQKIIQLNNLKTSTVNLQKSDSINTQTKIDVLVGQNSLMKQYLQMAPQAKKTIDIISIGEPIPDDIKIINVNAILRGVKIRFIVHKSDFDNQGLLHSWLRMGLEVRYCPEWGYHLVIFDGQQSILAVNNPSQTKERTSIVISSFGLSQALKNFFNIIWDKAQPI